MLYDPLIRLNPSSAQVEYMLAESVTPNSDFSKWTIKIKKGVVLHDGREFTSDDVIYSFQRMWDPKSPLPASFCIPSADVQNMKAIDKYTAELPLTSPFNNVVDALSDPYFQMVGRGFDVKNPIGTGPFKFKSFTPGVESTFVRNEHYWREGLPYADTIVTKDFADETSQVNALVNGQIDMVNLLSTQSTSVLNGKANVIVSKSGGWTPITMRTDQAPFNDPRVRQAFRLMADRDQMNQLVMGGAGIIANDVFGVFDPDYDATLEPRHVDVEQAKSLLKSAGKEGMKVDFIISNIAQGIVPMAQVFAQQATAAGVTLNVVNQTGTDFFANSYLKANLSVDFWYYLPYLVNASQATVGKAPFNTTHWTSPDYDSLYAQAITTKDEALKTELAHKLQKIDYDQGGNIIPFFVPQIDAVGQNVGGVLQAKSGWPLGGYDWASYWVS